ncbi:hypothetical protein QEN19_002925 [Hanseniaspora menglaensis]
MSNPFSSYMSENSENVKQRGGVGLPQQQFQQQQFSNQQQFGQQQFSNNQQFGQQDSDYLQQQNSIQPQFMQDPKAQLAYQIGSKAIGNFFNESNIQSPISNLNVTTIDNLTQYFQVSNRYVLHKIKIILCPFLNKSWYTVSPTTSSNSDNVVVLPRDNVNAPDLYIPIMSLITYILFWNFTKGLIGQFDPKFLYSKLSATLAMSLLDLCILKLGMYLIIPASQAKRRSLVELVCFVGYKYVPLNFNLIINQWVENTKIWFVLQTYLLFMFGIFLLRNVKFHIIVPGLTGGNGIIDRKQILRNCNYFLFFYGFIWQFVWMWVLN